MVSTQTRANLSKIGNSVSGVTASRKKHKQPKVLHINNFKPTVNESPKKVRDFDTKIVKTDPRVRLPELNASIVVKNKLDVTSSQITPVRARPERGMGTLASARPDALSEVRRNVPY